MKGRTFDMKCQKCGINIPDGKVYCEKCGTAVQMVPDYSPEEDFTVGEEEAESEGADTPVKRKRRLLKYGIVCLCLFFLGRMAFNAAYGYAKPEETIAEPEEEEEILPPPGKPQFSIQPGRYDYAPLLSISHEGNEEGSIYYTTNGSTPDTRSNLYEGPFEIGEGKMILRAVFIRSDGMQSEEADGIYEVVFDYPDEPVFDIPGGTYPDSFYVTLTTEPGCKIYYTTNGEEPGVTSSVYSGRIYIPSGLTVLQAVAVDEDGEMSGIMEAIYTVSENSASENPELDNMEEKPDEIP